MQSQSRYDRWIQWDDKGIASGYQHLKDFLAEEEQYMKALLQEEKYWDAFKRLNLMFLYQSSQLEAEVRNGGAPRTMPSTMYALLDWISENKSLIDNIVQGIGGDGYGISTSTYGMNISVSFSSGNPSNIGSNIGIQSPMRVTKKSDGGGINRATRQRARAPSPNANRSTVKNPNNPAFRAAANNRSNQMNRNSPAYRSARSGSRGKK